MEFALKISRRAEPAFRQSSSGMVLVATRVAQQPPQFPPIEYVHDDTRVEEIELGPSGTLYSYTVVHAGKDKPPYALAMVDFEPGVRAFGRLLYETQAPDIGAAVRVVPFALADGTADYAFQE